MIEIHKCLTKIILLMEYWNAYSIRHITTFTTIKRALFYFQASEMYTSHVELYECYKHKMNFYQIMLD